MDRGKYKDLRATLILCASVMASGSAPVLVSAFGASADTSRRQEMKVGDLVKLKSPTTRDFNKVFLVTEWRTPWLKVLGHAGWQRIADFEAINASR
jgi:hypothetical protein